MKIYTGDETGLLKEITLELTSKRLTEALRSTKGDAFTHNKKRIQTSDENNHNDKEETEDGVSVRSFGKVEKGRGLQKLVFNEILNLGKQRLIWLAYEDLSLELMDLENSILIYQLNVKSLSKEEDVNIKKITNKSNEKLKWIGLKCFNDSLISCLSDGTIYKLSLEKDMSNDNKEAEENKIQFKVEQRSLYSNSNIVQLEAFVINPYKENTFAIGGKEKDLELWDLDLLFEKEIKEEDWVVVKKEEDVEDVKEVEEDRPNENFNQNKNKDNKKNKALLFKAKNVAHDKLDLRVKVWIRAIQFMKPNQSKPYKIAVVTHYGQFRIYEPNKRQPVVNFQLGEKPFTTLLITEDQKSFVLSNNEGDLTVYSVEKAKLLGKYRGITGSIRQLQILNINNNTPNPTPILSSISLDRFLRFHHFQNGKRMLIRRVYLKHRPTCFFAINDDDVKVKLEEDISLEKTLDKLNDDQLWERLESIEKKKVKVE